MTLQSDNFAKQEEARKAFNDYMHYQCIFEEAEREKEDENTADKSNWSNLHAIPLTSKITPLKSFVPPN